MAEALYRKYRPQIFEDVVGQEHIERTIKNAIEQDKLSHAYLFTGPRGTGKTTTARLLAKALLCEHGPTAEPDGTCEDCEMIAAGEHPDVYELDAASRTGVDNVREEIIGRVQFAPTRGRYKVYIIDEVHMLTIPAFNALLKTLEEPPSHVVFILATTDPQKVPETIHSRCQRFDFRRISNEAIVSRLGAICVSEGVEFEGDALELIAHRAEGGMRNALTSLEQLIAFGDGAVTMEAAERMLGSADVSELSEIVKFVGTRDVAACFRWTAEFVETGADLAQFTRDFAEHVRNMYVMSLAGADVALEVGESTRRQLAEELKLFGPDRLARLLGVLGDLSAELKTSTNQRLSFEIALTRMVRPSSDLTLESLAERIEALESGSAAVMSAPAASQASAGVASRAAAAQSATQAASPQVGAGTGRASSMSASNAAARARESVEQAREERAAGDRAALRGVAAVGGVSGAVPAERSVGAANVAREAGSTSVAAGEPSAAQTATVSGGAAGEIPANVVASMRNPAALQRMWQTALTALKKQKAAYGVLFLNTKASFDEAAGVLAVDFPAENDFAFKAVQKPEVQDELAAALAGAFGAPLPFRLTKAGAGGVAVGARAAAATRSASSAAATSTARTGAADARQARGAAGGSMAAAGARPAADARAAASQRASDQPARDGAAAGSASAAVPGVDALSGASPVAPYESPTGYVPFDDQVPVDLYDDVVPYDDVPFDELPPIDVPGGVAPASAARGAQTSPASAARGAQTVPTTTAPEARMSVTQASVSAGSSQDAARANTPASAASFAGSAPSAAAVNVAASSAAAPPEGEPTLEELSESLAFGFGGGVTFTEM